MILLRRYADKERRRCIDDDDVEMATSDGRSASLSLPFFLVVGESEETTGFTPARFPASLRGLP
eukprot:scaffold34615_cov180-Amphora_coffeaeformis.AAC.19